MSHSLPFRARASLRSFLIVLVICASALSLTRPAHASHGPGASGGGSSTLSGETLKPGAWELSIREDYTEFEFFTRAQALARAQQGGDFDTLARGFLTSFEVAYGVMEDLQVGVSLGFFHGDGFKGADDAGEFGTVDPQGLTDLTLMGKYRILKGEPGNLSIVFGMKLPTGRDDIRLSNGERLSPTDQPGTGAFDFPIGIGYSRFLTPQITLDASALYIARTEHRSFKVGDRVNLAAAIAYRITEDIKALPQISVFAETQYIHLFRDRLDGATDVNTGCDTVYLTPGVRVRLDPRATLTVAPAFPVYQNVYGNQGKVDFKLAVILSYTF